MDYLIIWALAIQLFLLGLIALLPSPARAERSRLSACMPRIRFPWYFRNFRSRFSRFG